MMSGLRSLSTHFAGPAGAAVAMLPGLRNWSRTMKDLDTKLAEANARRAAAVAARDEQVVDAVEGNAAALKESDRLDKAIDNIDRDISRLSAAREKAAARVEAEQRVEAARRERAHEKAIRDAVAEWAKAAAAVDEATAALTAALAAFNGAGTAARVLAGGEGIINAYQQISVAVPAVIADRLAEAGYQFGRSPFLAATKRAMVGWVPDADYIVTTAAPLRPPLPAAAILTGEAA
jgi:hypothetical protein